MAVDLPFQHYLLGLFAVANNIPAIPLFMGMCRGRTRAEQHRLCLIATMASLATMLIAVFIGSAVLGFFGIGVDSFRIAGGILLLFSGLGMINAKPEADDAMANLQHSEIISKAVIPIAIPLTTGAGTISTLVLFAEPAHSPATFMPILVAVGIMSIINHVTFYYSPFVMRLLGHTGMDVLTKIFGLITLALGVQFIISGLGAAFPALAR